MTKICTKCKRELPEEAFPFRNKAKGTRRASCKECHNAFMKAKYEQKRDEIWAIKTNLKCQKCGYDSCPAALDFHHTDPTNKEERVAAMISSSYGLERAKNEISKCIVLCANCHREFHFLEKNKQITIEEFLSLKDNLRSSNGSDS